MEQLQNIKRMEPRPSLKNELMDKISNGLKEKEAPGYLKWVAAAALIINLIAVTQYLKSENASDEASYELFSTETTINY